ncbi:Tail-specific protease precursor [Fulvivirga imtechensis AK7]|uniref:Tail-specific protease n=1 Tax=Fulvivirga imtechensis AK7 TaxID=1237149 RepID=L8K1Q6_9BACT|nr:carboxy terminal-processing peptidase [Fulvivirga imtechensis]ELR73864.1 Tail-specific protease precursor [Fulvivirga imtechensis AK7]
MKKIAVLLAPILVLLSFITYSSNPAADLGLAPGDSTELVPKSYYGDEAKLIAQILDTYHYKKIKLNDSLSSVILDTYIETLDNNRSYFLKSDIESFEKFRTKIDDLTKAGSVSPAYEIYAVFKERFDNRMSFVLDSLVNVEFDYTIDEYYNTDRSKEAWSNNDHELNELWRKMIKSQTLSLRLNGKDQEGIKETITKRYERFDKAIQQYKTEDVFELYMNAVAEAFDPHTNYFSPRTSDRFKQNMSLSLEGIGARLQTETDFTKVVQVLPGGPAEKSNLLHENDRIVGVGQGEEGEIVDVIGWRIDDVVQLIKGPKGTTVRLEILPAETGVNGPSEVITLVRDKIKLEDMQAKAEVVPLRKDGREFKIGVITLPSFYMDFDAYQAGDPDYTSTTRDVKRLVEELEAQGIDGLMMDLRNNGGGSLAEAIDLTGLFIKDGPVVQVRTSTNRIEVGEDDDPGVIYDGPLAIMINRFSASASEIFAAAIQDYHRGVVIGEQTFGKGTVQSIIDLGKYLQLDGQQQAGQLKLTLQKFYRVTGSSTQHLGVNPDVNLPSAFDANEFGESASKGALPWDQIKSATFKMTDKVSPKMVVKLNDVYNKRLTSDNGLKGLVEDTRELKESLSKTQISLNEEKRKQEIAEAEKRKASRVSLSGTKIQKEGDGEKDAIKIEDPYLKEGVIILSEMISEIG